MYNVLVNELEILCIRPYTNSCGYNGLYTIENTRFCGLILWRQINDPGSCTWQLVRVFTAGMAIL